MLFTSFQNLHEGFAKKLKYNIPDKNKNIFSKTKIWLVWLKEGFRSHQ